MNSCRSQASRECPDAVSRRDPPSAVLNAATGGAGPLPVITTLLADPISVVSVTLDAGNLRNPSILLTFTGMVNLPIGVSVTLNFEVIRVKDNGAPIKVGPTHTFSSIVSVLESESFAFQFFDARYRAGIDIPIRSFCQQTQ